MTNTVHTEWDVEPLECRVKVWVDNLPQNVVPGGDGSIHLSSCYMVAARWAPIGDEGS